MIPDTLNKENNTSNDNLKSLEVSICCTEIYQYLRTELKRPLKGVSKREWETLFRMMDEHLPSFRSFIYSRYPRIKKSDYQICVLVRLYFRPSEIAVLTHNSQPYISINRYRLLMKIFREHGKAADFDRKIRMIR